MRRAIGIIALAGLSACGTNPDGPSPLKMALEKWRAGDTAPAPQVKRTPSRAQIDQSGLAMVQVNLDGEAIWPVMIAHAGSISRALYVNPARQQLFLSGVRIAGMRGFGTDLLGAKTTGPDPLATLIPPANWPEQIRLTARFAGDGIGGQVMQANCRFEKGPRARITLAERSYDTVRITERCTGDMGLFDNLHWVDVHTGQVWKSRQWIGPDMPALHIDVLEPLTP